MGLESKIVPARDLDQESVNEMFRLMDQHYRNVRYQKFLDDLMSKDIAILLMSNGCLTGFSTQVLFKHSIDGRKVNVVFSGDTIIERSYWGSLELPLAFGKMMLSIIDREPALSLYWFLTTKGYKTYRFLPVFFLEFCPCFDGPAHPFERRLLASLGRLMFPDRFNEEALILRAEKEGQVLREELAPITEDRRKDRHIAYFEELNPGHREGDELACLARFHRDNLKPFILRQLKGTGS